MQFILRGRLQCREMPIFPGGVCVCCVRAELGTASVLCMGTHSYPFSMHL